MSSATGPDTPRSGRASSRLAVVQHVLRTGELSSDCEAAAAAGYRGIAIDQSTLARQGVEAVDATLRSSGLVASSLLGLSQGPQPIEGQRAVDQASPTLEAVAELGAGVVLATSGPLSDRSVPDADRELRRWLASIGPTADALGVRIAIEPVHPLMRDISWVHTLGHALDLVQDIPGTGVALDIGHLWWDPNLVDRIATAVDDIVTVQVTDVSTPALAELRYERAQLGEGDVPVATLVGALEDAGYRGWYENEILVRMPRAERPGFLAETTRRFGALL